MSQYKKSLTFRLNLAKARTDKLMENQPLDTQTLIKMHQEEVSNIVKSIEQNPVISERNAKIADLQARIAQVDLADTYENL
jgi:Ni,Fe-hydrogenase III large subunit